MKKTLITLVWLLIPIQAWAVYDLPSDRTVPWSAGSDQWNGGTLPNYTSVTCTGLTEGNSTTNNGPAIQSCINAAAANTAVYIPAGIYYVNSDISLKSNVALRGAKTSGVPYLPTADATATTFKLGGSGAITIGSNSTVGSNVALSSGYTKGSQTLVTSSSPGVAVNDWIVVTENADSDVPVSSTGELGTCGWCGGPWQNGAGTQFMAQFVRVTSVNGNTIGISRPLYYTFKSGLSPVIKKMTFSTQKAGLENIRLNGDYADHSAFIQMEGALFSWVKGVETYNAGSGAKAAHVRVDFSHGCEVRDSYFHKGRDSSSDRNYGITFFFWNSDHKIENNILRHHRHSIDYEGGGAGTAVLYNYIDDNYTDDTSYLGSARFNHGAHPYMNLFEGNAISHIVADNYWGSSSHFTLFRNHFWGDQTGTGVPAAPNWGFIPVEIWTNQHYYSLVGNVLGITGKQRNPNWSSYVVINTNCSQNAMIQFCTSAARTTAIVHGNYDLKTNGVATWDGGDDHVLKNSMYYGSKPSFFGSLNWPAYGYDLSPVVGTLPAMNRFLGTSPVQLQPPFLHDIIP